GAGVRGTDDFAAGAAGLAVNGGLLAAFAGQRDDGAVPLFGRARGDGEPCFGPGSRPAGRGQRGAVPDLVHGVAGPGHVWLLGERVVADHRLDVVADIGDVPGAALGVQQRRGRGRLGVEVEEVEVGGGLGAAGTAGLLAGGRIEPDYAGGRGPGAERDVLLVDQAQVVIPQPVRAGVHVVG